MVLAQRLIRKICPDCKVETPFQTETLKYFGIALELLKQMEVSPEAKGCEACEGKGYRGRTAIFEVLEMSASLQGAILRGKSLAQISQIIRREGMLSLRESALRKALLGLTTPEEVVRVTPP
jgi:type II secretory ATPase GspE/PulE/Tfp pilus assembly ATPase PilB-like protein